LDVDFTLAYEGPLAASGRRDQKHEIRQRLHPQLKELWAHPPLSRFYWKARPGSQHLRTVGGYEFASIIHPGWHFNAKLKILMLRPEPPGSIVTSGGDIDNRLKTLFDALTCPNHEQDLPAAWAPTDDQKPFHCLLDDDGLISEVTVETDRLRAPPNRTHVKLLIRVHVHATDQFGGLAVLG
jgi:Holliday junction resolvase RusA-like endonuclease